MDTTIEGAKFIYKNKCGAKNPIAGSKNKSYDDSISFNVEYQNVVEGVGFGVDVSYEATNHKPSFGFLGSYEGI